MPKEGDTKRLCGSLHVYRRCWECGGLTLTRLVIKSNTGIGKRFICGDCDPYEEVGSQAIPSGPVSYKELEV